MKTPMGEYAGRTVKITAGEPIPFGATVGNWNCRCVLQPTTGDDHMIRNLRGNERISLTGGATQASLDPITVPDKFRTKQDEIDWRVAAMAKQQKALVEAIDRVNELSQDLNVSRGEVSAAKSFAEHSKKYAARLEAELNSTMGYLRRAAVDGDHAAKIEVERLETFLREPDDLEMGY